MAENQDTTQNVPPGSNNAGQPEGQSQGQAGPQFALQRIYLKDSSFESPRSPAVFQNQWRPKINFDIKTRNSKIQDELYEVVLVLTVEAQLDEQPAFLVEVHQAGIFTCKDFSDEQMEQLLASMCPSILFPYAREAIDNLVTKGSFPALMLAPINFDALYAQQKQQGQQSEQPTAEGAGDATATSDPA